MSAGAKIGFAAAAAMAIATLVVWNGRRESIRPVAPVAPAQPAIATATNSKREILPTTHQSSNTNLEASVRARLAGNASTEEVGKELEQLALSDPQGALAIARNVARNDEERHAWVTAILNDWARRDGDAAWEWVRDGMLGDSIPGEPSPLVTVFSAIAETDPSKIVGLVEAARMNGHGMAEFAAGTIDALLRTNNAAFARATVEKWAADERFRDGLDNAVFEKVAGDLAQRSPAEAANWLRSLPPLEGRNLAFATLAAEWSASAPSTAMQWAAGLDEGEGRGDAMQRVFNRWAGADMVAAAQWLAENESHPTTDKLIQNLVADTTLPETNPPLALRWAELIADPDLRARQIETLFLGWSDRDRAGAAKYLAESTGLTPEQKARLQQTLATRITPAPEGDEE
jgi:hypothetical protein